MLNKRVILRRTASIQSYSIWLFDAAPISIVSSQRGKLPDPTICRNGSIKVAPHDRPLCGHDIEAHTKYGSKRSLVVETSMTKGELLIQ